MKFIIKIEVDDRLELTMEKFWNKFEKLMMKVFIWHWDYDMVKITRYSVNEDEKGKEYWEEL